MKKEVQQNKSEQVYQYLKKKIQSGELEAGTPIKVNEVAETLSVSKIPVREALRQLEVVGLVEIIHNSGARVKRIDLDELEQIALMREKLEVLAINLAAEKIDAPTIASLRKMIAEMDRCTETDDKDTYTSINRKFHMTIYKASKADYLVDFIERLWDRSQKSAIIFQLFPQRFHESNNEHKAIVDALEKHDVKSAENILIKQKKEGFTSVVQILKAYDKLL